jgi:hypothetical protein
MDLHVLKHSRFAVESRAAVVRLSAGMTHLRQYQQGSDTAECFRMAELDTLDNWWNGSRKHVHA